MSINYFNLGSLVKLKTSFLGESVGTLCYVYEQYSIGRHSGVSLITENGVDLGGFSLKEQNDYLEYAGDTGQVYNFQSVIKLDNDFQNGVFKDFFTNPAYRRKLETNQ